MRVIELSCLTEIFTVARVTAEEGVYRTATPSQATTRTCGRYTFVKARREEGEEFEFREAKEENGENRKRRFVSGLSSAFDAGYEGQCRRQPVRNRIEAGWNQALDVELWSTRAYLFPNCKRVGIQRVFGGELERDYTGSFGF